MSEQNSGSFGKRKIWIGARHCRSGRDRRGVHGSRLPARAARTRPARSCRRSGIGRRSRPRRREARRSVGTRPDDQRSRQRSAVAAQPAPGRRRQTRRQCRRQRGATPAATRRQRRRATRRQRRRNAAPGAATARAASAGGNAAATPAAPAAAPDAAQRRRAAAARSQRGNAERRQRGAATRRQRRQTPAQRERRSRKRRNAQRQRRAAQAAARQRQRQRSANPSAVRAATPERASRARSSAGQRAARAPSERQAARQPARPRSQCGVQTRRARARCRAATPSGVDAQPVTPRSPTQCTQPPASVPAVCFWAPTPYASAVVTPGEGHAMRGRILVPAVGVDAGRGRRRRESPSACRTSRRRTSGSSTSTPWATSRRTRCARSPTRSRGSAGCSAGCRPSRPPSCCRTSRTTATPSPYSAPRNRLVFDVAPLSHAFETFPASERMYSLMNHELVHVAQGDIASEEDRRWRRFFLGKVAAAAAEPRIAALQLPDGPALHRAALVPRGRRGLHGDLDGRRAGPRAGRLRRDGVPRDGARRRPFLRSAGARVARHPRRFPGRARTPTSTARASSPSSPTPIRRRRSSRGSGATKGASATTPTSSSRCSASRSSRPGRTGSRSSTSSSGATSPRCASSRSRRTATWPRSADRVDLADVLRRGDRHPLRRLPLSRRGRHVGALNTRDGSVRRLADIKRAMLYRVTSFAYDPRSGTAFYTNDNLALRDLMAVDVKTGEERMLLEDARIGEIVFNPVDRSLMGVRHANGLATLVRIPYPYTEWNEVHTFPYEYVPYDLDISPDGRLLSASMSEVNGDQFLRVWELDKILDGRREAALRVPLRAVRPGELRVLAATGATCTAAATTPACPTSSATRSPPARSRRSRTRRPASSARCRSPTGGSSC